MTTLNMELLPFTPRVGAAPSDSKTMSQEVMDAGSEFETRSREADLRRCELRVHEWKKPIVGVKFDPTEKTLATAGALYAGALCTIGQVARAIESRFDEELHNVRRNMRIANLAGHRHWGAGEIPLIQLPSTVSLTAWYVAGVKLRAFASADLQKPWTSFLNPGEPLLLRYRLLTVEWRPPQNTILRHLARAYENSMARGTQMDDPLFDDLNTALEEMSVQKGTASRAPSQESSSFFLCSACSVCAMRKEGAHKVLPTSSSERVSFPAVSERPDEDIPLASPRDPGMHPNVVSLFNGATIDSSKPTSTEPAKPPTATNPPVCAGLHQGKTSEHASNSRQRPSVQPTTASE